MTLKQKLKWTGNISSWLKDIEDSRTEIASGNAPKVTFYWFVGKAHNYAVECYVEEDTKKSKEAAKLVVHAALEYFYGSWRKTLPTPDGVVGQEAWNSFCLWYDEVVRSLPWACALGDWKAARKIAEYPPQNRFPEAARAGGETAWGWALITFLRGGTRKQVEGFLNKAGADKAKRPKLLCPVLRALIENDAAGFEKTLLAYLAYYRKNEFKLDINKLLAFDGTTLYHLGRKQEFNVQLPESVADHIIRFD